jgi:lipopolysaccharide export system protein LptC
VRNALVMIVLAILAAASWIATWPSQEQSLPAVRNEDLGPPGYYVRGARLLGTDEQGRVTVTIRAERLEEVPNANRLQLEGVAIDYAPSDETAWTISAARASTPKDGSLLELAGDVEIRSVPSNGSKPQTILTQTLRFWPETSSVESNASVQLLVGDWRLDGTGFRTDLKGHTLRLESVHGTFAPR